MKNKILIALVMFLTIFMVGCNKDGYKSARGNYGGLREGCAVAYSPFYCADKYKPSSLAAGGKTSVFKDSDGRYLVLDANMTAQVEALLAEQNSTKVD